MYTFSGGGHGNPLQYSWLENPMDRGAWWATVHGVTQGWTQLSMYVCMYVYVCFRTEVLEKALESPLDSKKIKPVNPKGNWPWIFIGRTEGEVLILSLSEAKSWLIGKDPGSGKDWVQERKCEAEDEVLGWHHQLQGHESEQAMGRGEGQGSLACCSPRDCKELEMT